MEAAAPRSRVRLPPPSLRAKRPTITSSRPSPEGNRRRQHVRSTRRGRTRHRQLRRHGSSSHPPNWGRKGARTAAVLSTSEEQQRGSLPPCAQIQISHEDMSSSKQNCRFHVPDNNWSRSEKQHLASLLPCAQIQISHEGNDSQPKKRKRAVRDIDSDLVCSSRRSGSEKQHLASLLPCAQIQISHEGEDSQPKKRKLLLRRFSSQSPNYSWGAKQARSSQLSCLPVPNNNWSSSEKQHRASLPPCAQIQIRDEDEDSQPKKRQRPCSSQFPNYYWGAKRARSSQLPCLPVPDNSWRDWSNLDDGPVGLIAERVLAYDVADYMRFRAVCCPWRRCSIDPRTQSCLDRRFHPWRWILLREELAVPERGCFLNISTGECVHVDIPEFRNHDLLAITPEGLIVLVLHQPQRTTGRLLNPLTRQLTELPPLTTLLPLEDHHKLSEHNCQFDSRFVVSGSCIANDDSTFVLCFNSLRLLGIAKPGDDHWTLLKYNGDGMTTAPLMFEGRLYCVNSDGVMVLETGKDQPPRLEVAAKMVNLRVSRIADSFHLVNNCGELMLVHRHSRPVMSKNKSRWCYDAYRVDFDTRTLFPVKSLGGGTGRAVFMGMYCSLSVSLEVFPSISADTIYLSFDVGERHWLEVGAYLLVDGSVERPCTYGGGLVPRPHTLADCLSLSMNGEVILCA